MITANVTGLDRNVRMVVGGVLAWTYLSGHAAAAPVLGIGLALMLTGLVGWCPLYALFHLGGAAAPR